MSKYRRNKQKESADNYSSESEKDQSNSEYTESESSQEVKRKGHRTQETESYTEEGDDDNSDDSEEGKSKDNKRGKSSKSKYKKKNQTEASSESGSESEPSSSGESKSNSPPKISSQPQPESQPDQPTEEEKLNEEIGRRGKPMFWTNFIIKYPLAIVAFVYFLAILSLFIIINYDLYELNDYADRTYLVYSSDQVELYDTVQAAQDWVDDSFVNLELPLRTQLNDKWTTTVIFKSHDDDVFTLENIRKMDEILNHIRNMDEIKTFCIAQSSQNSSCSDNFEQSLLPYIKHLTTKEEVDQKLALMAKNPAIWENMRPLVGKDYDPQTHTKTIFTRAIFYFGNPIEIDGERYKRKSDRYSTQLDHFQEFGLKMYDYVNDADQGNMDIYSVSYEAWLEAFNQVMESAAVWAIGSFCFVFLYLTFHVKSVFLASGGMLEAVMSMPVAYLIYRGVFGISFFNALHIFSIYIILGTTADHIFLFTDTWGQSHVYPSLKNSISMRLSWTFKKSVISMLATASTTAVAFLSTAFSKIMPISSFGYFAFLLVTFNFLIIMIQYPAYLILYEKYISKYFTCCSFCLKKCKKDDIENQKNSEDEDVRNTEGKLRGDKGKKGKNKNDEGKNKEIAVIGFSRKFGIIDNFFANYWNFAINKLKYLILLITLIWISIAIWRVFQMKGLSKQEQFFPDDHPLQISEEYFQHKYYQSEGDLAVKVRFVWGVKGLDKDGVVFWDPEDIGQPIWDDEFSTNTNLAQRHILKICDDMEKLIQTEMRTNTSVKCFMKSFIKWAESKNLTGEDNLVPSINFNSLLKNYTEHTEQGRSERTDNLIGIDNQDRLKYIQIHMITNIIPFTNYDELMPIHDKWIDRIETYNEGAPHGLKKGLMTAMFDFCFMITEKELLTGALTGMAIALAFVLVVLIICTQNFIIAIFSVITILFIVLSVVCIMELNNWEFGIAESISCVIMIGFSVDYVVHLGNMYVRAPFTDRHNRMKEALKQIAATIIGAGITTMGAGIFLYFPPILLYTKFATLIVSNICFSLYYSLVFFTALAHICGPQGECGGVAGICRIHSGKKSTKGETEGVFVHSVGDHPKGRSPHGSPNTKKEGSPSERSPVGSAQSKKEGSPRSPNTKKNTTKSPKREDMKRSPKYGRKQ